MDASHVIQPPIYLSEPLAKLRLSACLIIGSARKAAFNNVIPHLLRLLTPPCTLLHILIFRPAQDIQIASIVFS